ncbi:methyl-accepting chemotaxis protein [Pectinatus frisingensis]|uniref:methyl-accepting chemotaxis protein n=1 Tax=Pectinatus frisingensis TaxID=865 RepID=UPI0018C51E88|nr:methyl-accepting chemotaxis protein [Pectinatus frisingensis]
MHLLADLKIKTKLGFLVFSTVIFIIIVGYMGHYASTSLSDKLDNMYNDRLQPIQWLDSARAESRNNEALTYYIFLSKDSTEQQQSLADLNEHKKNYMDFLAKYQKLDLDAAEKDAVNKIETETRIYREVWQKSLTMAMAGNQDNAMLYFKQNAAPHLTIINKTLDDLAAYDTEMAQQENAQGKKITLFNNWASIVVTLLAIILSGGLGFLISRYIAIPLNGLVKEVEELTKGNFTERNQISNYHNDEIGQLGRSLMMMKTGLRELISKIHTSANQLAASAEELSASAEQSAQASDQVAGSVTQVADGAEKQLDLTDKANSIVKQISIAIAKVADNAETLSQSANQTATAADKGEASVKHAVNQMSIIEGKTNDTAKVISALEEKSKQIGQIVDVISDIARQTNLLALNAAIEAAGAGEAGKGFSVVAEEVRKLAEQSQEAAKRITELIGEVQSNTDSAVVYMDDSKKEVDNGTGIVSDSGEKFEQILHKVNDMTAQIKGISSAIEKVTAHARNVVDAVDSIDKESKKASAETQNISAATEEQSATVGEIASASGNLAKLAEKLQSAVQKFKV